MSLFCLPVPSPTDTTIIRRPQVDTYTVGLNLDLVCRVVFISAVDSALTLTSMWTREGKQVTGDGEQLVVRDFQRVNTDFPHQFESVIEFKPLVAVENNTDYTCDVTIAAQDTTYITGSTATVSTNLTVEGNQWFKMQHSRACWMIVIVACTIKVCSTLTQIQNKNITLSCLIN